MVILIILLGLLPGLAWLLFYLQEDKKRPEPRWLLLFVFLAGAAVTLPAVGIEVFARNVLRTFDISDYGAVSFLVLASIEEVFKFGAAYLIIRHRREFDEPIDAMVYLVTAAMGFATAENLAVNSGLLSDFVSRDVAAIGLILGNAFDITTRRFIGATLLHSLSSGLIGYYWALGISRQKVRKYLFIGLIIGTLLHAIFNYFIIKDISIAYPTIFLTVVAFFVLKDFEKLKA
jgi:RsiW-degrading membrane proteinase PrsW (M82 family)